MLRLSVVLFVFASCTPVSSPAPAAPQRSAEDVVREFGLRMKEVSTTATSEIASEAIRRRYAGLVEPQLLDSWASSPATAPGRKVSSPWPERIDIASSSNNGAETIVRGEIVEMTSAGESGRAPIEVRLRRSGGAWLITAVEMRAADDPRAVIDAYYRAIASRDYQRAYRMWGENGPPGQTLDEFAEGFADTASVVVTTRAPSRIEGAAGSQYAEVPATVEATTTAGRRQRFEGTYTLRRSMVDGASPSQRRWHVEKASIREVAP